MGSRSSLDYSILAIITPQRVEQSLCTYSNLLRKELAQAGVELNNMKWIDLGHKKQFTAKAKAEMLPKLLKKLDGKRVVATLGATSTKLLVDRYQPIIGLPTSTEWNFVIVPIPLPSQMMAEHFIEDSINVGIGDFRFACEMFANKAIEESSKCQIGY